MPNVFGYDLELPPDEWHGEPMTDRQRMVIEKALTYREVAKPYWRPLMTLILSEAGFKIGQPFHLTKGCASVILDFFINAEAASKKLAEKRLMDRISGQGELL